MGEVPMGFTLNNFLKRTDSLSCIPTTVELQGNVKKFSFMFGNVWVRHGDGSTVTADVKLFGFFNLIFFILCVI